MRKGILVPTGALLVSCLLACSEATVNRKTKAAAESNDSGFLSDRNGVEFLGSPYSEVGTLTYKEAINHLLTDSPWITKLDDPITVFDNFGASPFGEVTAERLMDESEIRCSYVYQKVFPYQLETGGKYFFSVFLKPVSDHTHKATTRVKIGTSNEDFIGDRYTEAVVEWGSGAAGPSVTMLSSGSNDGYHVVDIAKYGDYYRVGAAIDWDYLGPESHIRVHVIPACPLDNLDRPLANGSVTAFGAQLDRLN